MSLLAVTINFTFQDGKNKTSTTEIKVPVGLSIPEYIDAAQKLGEILVNNTLALLTQVEVCLGLNLTLPPIQPAADSDVQEKGQFVFSAANGTNFVMYLPAFNENYVVAGSDSLDTADADVAAMVTLMEDGNGTIIPVNVRDQAGFDLDYARETFRRR